MALSYTAAALFSRESGGTGGELSRVRRAPVFFFAVAVIVYALFGSPTPDDPGLVELVVGTALVLSAAGSAALAVPAGLCTLSSVYGSGRGTILWVSAGWGFLLYVLLWPLLSGVISGNDPGRILRDVIPALFWMLPLFLAPVIRAGGDSAGLLVFRLILFAGWMFGARALLHVLSAGQGFFQMTPPDLLYLSNAPTLLFAAVFLSGWGLMRIGAWPRAGAQTVYKGAAYLALACVPLAAMASVMQRATLAYLALALAFFILFYLWQRPRHIFLPLLLLGGFVAVFAQEISLLFEVLYRKAMLVGWNMRFEDLAAVYHRLWSVPGGLVFGCGLGCGYESPAVAGINVNYTHFFLSAVWMKTGLPGLLLILLYLAGLCRAFLPLFARALEGRLVALALAGPVLISVFLYASYKSLDFGLLLLILAMFSEGGPGKNSDRFGLPLVTGHRS